MANKLTTTGRALAKDLNSLNPTIDYSDPIIADGIINFGANIVDDVAARVSYINTRYTSAYLNQLSDAELDFYAYNALGLTRKAGTPVTGFVYVMFNSAPSSSLSIPSNTIFATSDGVWQYFSTQSVVIDPSMVNILYNSVRSCYEIRIPVQAVKVGTDYRVAAYRISKAQTFTNLSIRVENRESFVNGSDPESTADFIKRIQAINAGFDSNSIGGFYQMMMEKIAGLQDVNFRHLDDQRNAYELYYIGFQPTQDLLTVSIANPSNRAISFPPDKTPIRYIDSVAINSVALPSSSYTYSTSKLYLSPNLTLTSSDVVQIAFQYNKLNLDIYDFLENNFDFPGAKWILNEGVADYLNIKIVAKPQSYMTITEVQDLIQGTLIEYINTSTFSPGIQAEELRQLLLSVHPSILDCRASVNGSPFYSSDFGHYPVILRDNIVVELMP
jgi:hypothetical protein